MDYDDFHDDDPAPEGGETFSDEPCTGFPGESEDLADTVSPVPMEIFEGTGDTGANGALKLDSTDYFILGFLRENGTATNETLAALLKLDARTVQRHAVRLRRCGKLHPTARDYRLPEPTSYTSAPAPSTLPAAPADSTSYDDDEDEDLDKPAPEPKHTFDGNLPCDSDAEYMVCDLLAKAGVPYYRRAGAWAGIPISDLIAGPQHHTGCAHPPIHVNQSVDFWLAPGLLAEVRGAEYRPEAYARKVSALAEHGYRVFTLRPEDYRSPTWSTTTLPALRAAIEADWRRTLSVPAAMLPFVAYLKNHPAGDRGLLADALRRTAPPSMTSTPVTEDDDTIQAAFFAWQRAGHVGRLCDYMGQGRDLLATWKRNLDSPPAAPGTRGAACVAVDERLVAPPMTDADRAKRDRLLRAHYGFGYDAWPNVPGPASAEGADFPSVPSVPQRPKGLVARLLGR